MPQAPTATEGVILNLIPAGEGLPLAPSICFICEQSPSNGAIDTLRTFMTQPPTHLTGRKYVCTDCVKSLAALIGFVDPSIHNLALNEVEALRIAAAEDRLRIEQLEAIHIETLKDLLKKATKPAPTRAPKAAS